MKNEDMQIFCELEKKKGVARIPHFFLLKTSSCPDR
jgi:hypothetical protein